MAGGEAWVSVTEMQKLNEIAIKVSGMEATQRAQAEAIGKMASSVDRLIDKLDKSDDVAREADQRAKSAHHRIDELADNQRWLWRTIVGAMIAGAIAFIWKGMGS